MISSTALSRAVGASLLIVTFFQTLQKTEGNSPRAMAWISDHPATSDRITHINAYIAANNLTGTNLGQSDLATIRRRLGGR